MECVCVAAKDAAVELFGECAASDSTQFIAVDGGDCFSIGVDAAGAVFGWGSGFYGELTERRAEPEANDKSGADDTSSLSSTTPAATATDHPPVCVRALVAPTQLSVPEKCVRVSCGTNHVLAVSQQGNLYAWGWNRRRQVSPSAHEVISMPSLVKFPEPVNVRDIAGGGIHSLALDSDGRVWSWGDNTHGQLGWAHSALLTPTGELFTVGWGLYHQLGHGSTQNQLEPRSVDALSGLDAACGGPIVQMACGNWHTAARTAAGDVYTWGWGRDGQLGHGAAVTSQPLPRVVAADDGYFDADDTGHRAVDVACGSRHTLVLSANGDLHWWGKSQQRPPSRDAWGQLTAKQVCKRVAMGHTHALLLVQSTSNQRGNSS